MLQMINFVIAYSVTTYIGNSQAQFVSHKLEPRKPIFHPPFQKINKNRKSSRQYV